MAEGTKDIEEYLNRVVGEDLSLIKGVLANELHLREEIKAKLDEGARADVEGQLKDTANDLKESLSMLKEKHQNIKERSGKAKEGAELEGVYRKVKDMTALEDGQKYLFKLQEAHDICARLEAAEKARNGDDGVRELHALREATAVLAKAPHPIIAAKAAELFSKWESKLTQALRREFADVLREMNWPEAPSWEDQGKAKRKFEDTLAQLLLFADAGKESAYAAQLLLEPLAVKFQFHFCSNQPTNRVDRPEWALSFAKSTLHAAVPFLLSQSFQKVQGTLRLGKDLHTHFTEAFAQIIGQKIKSDLEKCTDNITLFTSIVRHALQFDKELRTELDYLGAGCTKVLTDDECRLLNLWLEMETLASETAMVAILDGDTPWALAFPDILQDDKFKLPVCTEQFMALQERVLEVYDLLLSDTLRARWFHSLQYPLLQAYHEEIDDIVAQTLWNLSTLDQVVRMCTMINAVNYVRLAVAEWAEDVTFLTMPRTLSDSNKAHDDDGTTSAAGAEEVCMSAVQKKLAEMLAKFTTALIDSQVRVFKALARPLLSVSFDMNPDHTAAGALPELSKAHELASSLAQRLRKHLAADVCENVLQRIAKSIADMLYTDVLMAREFTLVGAQCFEVSVNALAAIFANHPLAEGAFDTLREVCVLLTQPVSSWSRLYGILNTPSLKDDQLKSLRDLNISILTPDRARLILGRRCDTREAVNPSGEF